MRRSRGAASTPRPSFCASGIVSVGPARQKAPCSLRSAAEQKARRFHQSGHRPLSVLEQARFLELRLPSLSSLPQESAGRETVQRSYLLTLFLASYFVSDGMT